MMCRYHGDEMHRLMPNSRLVCDAFSSHASLLEHPERVMREVSEFVRYRRLFRRTDSSHFIARTAAESVSSESTSAEVSPPAASSSKHETKKADLTSDVNSKGGSDEKESATGSPTT
mmetsp:Transcript_18756/g.35946  ORF Transcript_18756/g.35946 Transcript_18756/m.35946 type:complete len:117 (-) Transcript_18756:243-593(-)